MGNDRARYCCYEYQGALSRGLKAGVPTGMVPPALREYLVANVECDKVCDGITQLLSALSGPGWSRPIHHRCRPASVWAERSRANKDKGQLFNGPCNSCRVLWHHASMRPRPGWHGRSPLWASGPSIESMSGETRWNGPPTTTVACRNHPTQEREGGWVCQSKGKG